MLYIDAVDGRILGIRQPWQGKVGDLFLQLQFPLHSGWIAGVFGRVLVSAMGLVVATLAVTGVVIWWKKQRARMWSRRPAEAEERRLGELKPRDRHGRAAPRWRGAPAAPAARGRNDDPT